MKINIHFFVVLLLALITIVSDFAIYFCGCDYELSLLIGLAITTTISVVLLLKKKIKPELNFDKLDMLFLIFLGCYSIINIAIPCIESDVAMYHTYLQENPFTDKVNFDFFPGRTRNSFLFPLGDRMFYVCRFLLGYRLGTILSYYCVIVLYYQVKI